ncbi:serine hydrolase domain-containing protein [Hymenobacter crusticola]|uniref:Beta-lactamase-related domain-containing protein n=1 Tax=Hymenobacter crusticola TaxID=1770526 RepID=A0A243W6V8_9BACT|nr:serine hydrolase domain-containing protein [Hymenobacter crusticola]OUJ70372.1 hypothetical protein BXP70_24355 [Hymenobacter crusticola]
MKSLLLSVVSRLGALLVALPLAISCPPQAHGQTLPFATQQQIDSVFARWNNPTSPGAVLGVVHHGHLVYQRAYGQANLARQEPLTTAHRFWVASMAKQFTAASIALLAEQGKLGLDDDIRRYLPELPWLGDTVRIRHLVHHTSGLRDGFTLIGLTLRGERHYTNANVLAMLRKQRGRNFRPGERHEYNNGGYVLLAEIVARVSRQSFAAFTEQHIFRPLGMTHTRFEGQLSAAIPHLATGYAVRYPHGQPRYHAAHFRGHTVGSSGLVTTLADLVRWDQNFYQNQLGQRRPELLQLLLTPGRLTDGTSTGYAFGLEVTPYRGQPAITHNGTDPGYQAEIVRLPRQQLTLICLANTQNLYGLTQQLFRLAEQLTPAAFDPRPAPTTPDRPRADLAGIYLEPRSLATVRILTLRDSTWHAAASTQGYARPLRSTGPDNYVNQGLGEYSYAFGRAENGPVQELRYRERSAAATLHKTAPATLTPAELRGFAGRYYSPELNQQYRLTVRRGQLRLSLYRLVHVPLQPLAGNRFLADLQGHNCLAFQRDQAGTLTGFTFHREAINGLIFRRR